MSRITRSNNVTVGGSWVSGGEMYPGAAAEAAANEQMDVPMQTEEMEKKQKPWIKYGPDGKVIKRKPNPKKKNAILRRALHPKSAIMCLNELQSGLIYEVEPLAPVGNYCATVDVNGQQFRGYGTSKSHAKQAAAEAALVSFVKPPPPKPAPGQNPTEIEDETPWKSIASFAMFKLFSDWSEGRVGNQHVGSQMSMHQNYSNPPPPINDLRGYLNQNANQTEIPQNDSVGLHLNQAQPAPTPALGGAEPHAASTAKPAKGLSEEAKKTRHPVMVLHQLMPTIKYDSCEEFDGANRAFTLSTYVGATPYAGSGSSVKKAKFALAKLILKEAFGIDNEYEQKA